jgi:hypothetical protein
MIRVRSDVVVGSSTTTRRNVVLASPTSPQAPFGNLKPLAHLDHRLSLGLWG